MKITDEIDYQREGIARKVIMKNESGMVLLMAFDKDTYLDTHFMSADIMATILEGSCEFTIDDNHLLLQEGDFVKILPGAPYSICAPERFKMLVTKLNLV